MSLPKTQNALILLSLAERLGSLAASYGRVSRRPVGRSSVDRPFAGGAGRRGLRAAPPTCRPAMTGSDASAPPARRSTRLGRPVSGVGLMAGRRPDSLAGHRHRMAPARVRRLLALEVTTPRTWAAENRRRHRRLIREMQAANPLRGAPRIHGELRKLGIATASTRPSSAAPSLPSASRRLLPPLGRPGRTRSSNGSSAPSVGSASTT